MSELRKGDVTFSVGKTFFAILAITFVAEFLVMAMLGMFGYNPRSVAAFLANAALLCAVIAPPLYLLVLFPIKRAYEVKQRAAPPPTASALGLDKDPMTRVLNRQAITVDLLEAVAEANRYDTRLSVAMADVDQLQRINDEYGRQAGDRVLQSVAETLVDALRMPDRVGRYAGKDFLLVLPQTTLEDASKLADRIRESVSKIGIQGNNHTFNATISMGITQFHKGEDIEHLLSRVEQAIVEAKQQGSNLAISKGA